MKCGGLLYGKKFPLKLKRAVYKIYIRPANKHGSKAWCLKESKIGILQRTERSMVGVMCGVHHRDSEKANDL